MRHDTLQALDNLFRESPILKAEGVPTAEIAAAEAEIGAVLSDDYKDFLSRYGGAIVGPFPVFGLRRAAPMAADEGSFVDVTNFFRRQRWPGVEDWTIISWTMLE